MQDTLERISAEIRACHRCDLHFGRKQSVPGDGSTVAKIMFIGEGPGFHEDQQGLPFVGPAGRFLEELLAMIGMNRSEVYITNVVKCRPPSNRDPQPEEIEACRGYLERQIAIIQPKMVITLGRYSMARYIPNARISLVHGQVRKIDNVLVYPMYHPAAALHQPSLRPQIEADMLKIPDLLAQREEMPDSKPQEEARQMSLF